MNNFTLILIYYILFNWLLLLTFLILPRRVLNKVLFLFIIICPPLIIGFIGELISKLIKEKHDKKKKMILNCFYPKGVDRKMSKSINEESKERRN